MPLSKYLLPLRTALAGHSRLPFWQFAVDATRRGYSLNSSSNSGNNAATSLALWRLLPGIPSDLL